VLSAFARRVDVFDAIRKEDESNAVVVLDGGESQQSGYFVDGIPFGFRAVAGAAGGGGVDEQPDGEFALFDVAFDVRLAGACGGVPINGADVVAFGVGAEFVEVHAASFEDTVVLAGEQVLDRIAGLQLQLLEPSFEVVRLVVVAFAHGFFLGSSWSLVGREIFYHPFSAFTGENSRVNLRVFYKTILRIPSFSFK
jgi:hypothetical protein